MSTCKTCRWWIKAGEYHECHRNPPLSMSNDFEGLWPYTGPDDWCGEWTDETDGLAHPMAIYHALRKIYGEEAQ